MTETDWELGNRRVTTYPLRLMEYKVRIEQQADKKNQEKTEDKKTISTMINMFDDIRHTTEDGTVCKYR